MSTAEADPEFAQYSAAFVALGLSMCTNVGALGPYTDILSTELELTFPDSCPS